MYHDRTGRHSSLLECVPRSYMLLSLAVLRSCWKLMLSTLKLSYVHTCWWFLDRQTRFCATSLLAPTGSCVVCQQAGVLTLVFFVDYLVAFRSWLVCGCFVCVTPRRKTKPRKTQEPKQRPTQQRTKISFEKSGITPNCKQQCVTRRKLQSPGSAEDHKKQETPTINPIDRQPTHLTYDVCILKDSDRSALAPVTNRLRALLWA